MENISKKQKFYKGSFTLMELIVIIAIIIIITGIVFAMTEKTKGQAVVTNACNEVASFYNKARSYALTGKIVSSGNVPRYFKLGIEDASNKVISIYSSDDMSIDSLIESITLKDNVSCGPSGYAGNGASLYGSKYFTVPSGDAVPSTGNYDIDCVYCSSYKADGTCNNNAGALITKTVTVNDFKAECK